jgi:hypothetical protein
VDRYFHDPLFLFKFIALFLGNILLTFLVDYTVAWQYGILLTHGVEGQNVKALLLVSHNQPYISLPSSSPTTPTSTYTPPPPFSNSPSEEKSSSSLPSTSTSSTTYDFFEVRVEGDPEVSARVFRGINETIEMMCQKRYPPPFFVVVW